jgi:hypothetical protein
MLITREQVLELLKTTAEDNELRFLLEALKQDAGIEVFDTRTTILHDRSVRPASPFDGIPAVVPHPRTPKRPL